MATIEGPESMDTDIPASDQIAHVKRLMTRRTATLRARAERAEQALRDAGLPIPPGAIDEDLSTPPGITPTPDRGEPVPAPGIGAIVHYVSYGTPGGEYPKACRAAIVTAVHDRDPVPAHGVPYVDLCVLNPTGQFFNQAVEFDAGGATLGAPDCPDREFHGNPHRYCVCGWIEPTLKGGTWHPACGR